MSERLEKPTKLELEAKVLAMEPEDVMKGYRGRPGCMCGCLGEYFVTEAAKGVAAEDTGYEYDEEQIDDGKVRRILRKIQKEVREGNESVDIAADLYYAYVENDAGSRCWAVYPLAPAKKRLEERACRAV